MSLRRMGFLKREEQFGKWEGKEISAPLRMRRKSANSAFFNFKRVYRKNFPLARLLVSHIHKNQKKVGRFKFKNFGKSKKAGKSSYPKKHL